MFTSFYMMVVCQSSVDGLNVLSFLCLADLITVPDKASTGRRKSDQMALQMLPGSSPNGSSVVKEVARAACAPPKPMSSQPFVAPKPIPPISKPVIADAATKQDKPSKVIPQASRYAG